MDFDDYLYSDYWLIPLRSILRNIEAFQNYFQDISDLIRDTLKVKLLLINEEGQFINFNSIDSLFNYLHTLESESEFEDLQRLGSATQFFHRSDINTDALLDSDPYLRISLIDRDTDQEIQLDNGR